MPTLLIQEVIMKQRDRRLIGRCFGTAMVGPRGQLVIPVEARKELGIDSGNKFLVFGQFEGQGLMFIKVEAAEEFLGFITSRLDEVARVVKESKSGDVGKRGKGSRS
jgi:bifunctional DNA-binding transcriptional regulator/antitoxin component of YhaV-PrlF toxin-antitoxin module